MCKIAWVNDYAMALKENRAVQTTCFCDNNKFKKWDLIRFCIENHYGMVIFPYARHTKKSAADSCVIAFRECDFKKPFNTVFAYGDNTVIPNDEITLIIRMPIHAKVNTYIPQTIYSMFMKDANEKRVDEQKHALTIQFQNTNSESERLEIMQRINELSFVDVESFQIQRMREHPSRKTMRQSFGGFIDENGKNMSWQSYVEDDAPDNWICLRCFNHYHPVHYAKNCPTNEIDGWIPMNKRRPPLGIPKNMLVSGSWSNPEHVAKAPYLDSQNKLWFKK